MFQSDNISLEFFGAAGTVTGSRHLLRLGNHTILIDCGLFQGVNEKQLNALPLPVAAKDVDCILLTHAHLDHTGNLPFMVKQGFKGKIYGTSPTLQIAEIILSDSAKIQEEEYRQAKERTHNRKHNHKKHDHSQEEPISLPDYIMDDVLDTVKQFVPVTSEEWFPLFDDVTIRFRYNGHIIGASFIEIKYNSKQIVFSGDIGRENDILLFHPNKPEHADILVIESTYGNRLHPDNTQQQLADCINETTVNQGTIIIPSFAVERTQMLMYMLWKMKQDELIPDLPVYMDSPMGKDVLEIFHHNKGWHKLPPDECTLMCKSIHRIQSIKETFEVIDDKQSKIVIAGSGMVTGGRVLTYLQYYIENPSTTILLAGFQAKGTNGRLLQDGVEEIMLRGRMYKVKASIKTIHGLSGHADQKELLNWMSALQNKPEKIFIVHGEPEAAETLKNKIKELYDMEAEVAVMSKLGLAANIIFKEQV